MKSHEFVPFIAGISATATIFSRNREMGRLPLLSAAQCLAQPQRWHGTNAGDLPSDGCEIWGDFS
jgi:hypothetical protein